MNILYDGVHYSVGEADLEAIKQAIEQAHERGVADWITVNFGEGRPQPAQLLVGRGIPISIVPIPSDDPAEQDDDEAEVRATDVGGVDSPDDLSG
ncbi:hypothetical protein [Agromyces tropicus]|uniref:hypothetical protein n=1 Tax=Agromyces tropicus TaxID=555371 RepID=UPI0031E3C94E